MRGWKHREAFKKHYEKFYPQFVQQHTAQMQANQLQAQIQAGMFMAGMPPTSGMPGDSNYYSVFPSHFELIISILFCYYSFENKFK